MKKVTSKILGLSVLFLLPALPSLAANITLTNGGLGQVAGNTQSFGVAVCAKGAQPLGQSVPISITTGDQTVTIPSASSIPAGSCVYSYANYSQFGMTSGKTYSITVTIDPQHTVISNTDNQAMYDVTAPEAAAGGTDTTTAGTNHLDLLAAATAAFANFFSAIAHFFKF